MKEIFKKIKTGSLIITISIVLFVVSVVSLVSFNYIYSIKYNDEISESIDTIEDIFTLMGEEVDVEYQPLNRTINIYVASPVLGDYSFNAFSKMIKKDIHILLCSSNEFIEHCATTMASILYNLSKDYIAHFYILSYDLFNINNESIEEICQ